MPKIKEILTELEALEIAKLRLLLVRSDSIVEARNYKKKIMEIIEAAKKRYNDSLET